MKFEVLTRYASRFTLHGKQSSVVTIVSLVILFSVSQIIRAGEVIKSDVTYDNGVYSINVIMDINGDISRTREILLDYSQTPRYNDNIIKSELLKTTVTGKKIGRVVIRDCLLFLCRTLVQVQEMEKLSSGDIQIHVIPERSDYNTGDYMWHITPGPYGVTRLRVNAVIAPKISVPPVIGPVLISHKLKTRMIGVINKLERLSRQDYGTKTN